MKQLEDFLPVDDLEKYQLLKNKDAKRIFIQEAAKRYFPLMVHILGYRDTGRFHIDQMENIAAVRSVGDYSSRRLWLWSRGHFKTSLITEAHSVWLIVNNPNIRVLLVSNTIGIAEKILRNIKGHFISNDEFRYFFREYCPTSNLAGKIDFGTSEYFTTPARKQARKEPTMMVAGIGTNLTGLHFDYEKIDDLVTKDSVSNDTQIQTSKDYYSTLRQLFDNPSYPKEDIIGTIYHFNDLYCELRKSRRMVESFVPVSQEGGVSFPERFSQESLSDILIDVGPYEYATQYMLNPVNPSDAKFKGEWVHYYGQDSEKKLPEGLAEYITCDPASTQKKRSDYTVIMRWGVDHDGNHYLLEGVRDKFTAFQRVDALFSIVRNSRSLKWVKYEVIGGRHGDLEIIKKRQIDEQLFFNICETKSSTGSKADRVEQRLVPAYHAGVIYWPRALMYKSMYDGKTHDFVQDILLEFLQFPFSEHDDILDCQSQMFEDPKMIIKGSAISVVQEKKAMTADDWEKFYNNLEKEKNMYKGLTDKEIESKRLVKRFKRLVAKNA